MVGPPPSLPNGYVWMAHTPLSVSRANRLEGSLRSVRCELRTRDITELDDPNYQVVVELWVHPDDRAEAWAILRPLLRDK